MYFALQREGPGRDVYAGLIGRFNRPILKMVLDYYTVRSLDLSEVRWIAEY